MTAEVWLPPTVAAVLPLDGRHDVPPNITVRATGWQAAANAGLQKYKTPGGRVPGTATAAGEITSKACKPRPENVRLGAVICMYSSMEPKFM